MRKSVRLSLTLLLVVFTATVIKAQTLHPGSIKSTKDLKEFFKYTGDRVPLICGHRGGVSDVFPENSMEAFEYLLSKVPTAFIETDPRMTKDGVVVIMHDVTLDRTTTGTGNVSDYTYKELQALRLKDKDGNPTPYKIPTLDEVLQWAKGKTIIQIDKKDVPADIIYDAIMRNNAEHVVIISAYIIEDAIYFHGRNKNLMFESFIRNDKEFAAYEKAGVPWSNLFAYLGQPKSPEFVDALHKKGVMCMVFSAKVIEKGVDKPSRLEGYKMALDKGTDIFLSDRAIEAYEASLKCFSSKNR